MRHRPTGKMIQIVITNQKIFYDWKTNEKSAYYLPIKADCKKGYITKDANGREIGITYMADAKYYGMSYMLFFKKFEDELGKFRLVKTKSNETFKFSKLEEILKTQEEFDDLQIEI